MDWSATAAYTALIAAIVSPIITTAITICHQTRMKRMEVYHVNKIHAFENYLSAATKCLLHNSNENLQGYGSAKGNVYLYAPPGLWPQLDKMDSLMDYYGKSEKEEARALLAEISKALSSEYTRIEKN